MLDVQRIHVLVEFARHGTIAATAKALGYTASAVSQQLSTLESEAKVPLLDRSARSAELTDAGRLLVEHGEQILATVEAAESALAAGAGDVTGQVKVTAFPTAAVAFAAKLASGVGKHHMLQIVLRQAAGAVGTRSVSAGEADLAVAEGWLGSVPGTPGGPLHYHHLLTDPLVLAIPRRHRLADTSYPIDLAKLRDEPWIVAPRGEPSRNGVEQLLAPHGGPPTTAWEFEGQGTILSLVAREIGIAAVPSLALTLGTSGVRYRRLGKQTPARDIYVVARAASLKRPSIKAVLEVLTEGAQQIGQELATTLDGARTAN